MIFPPRWTTTPVSSGGVRRRECKVEYAPVPEFRRSQAVISIQDDEPGFDPSSLPDPTDSQYICRPYGRGIMLMRTFMDEMAYNCRRQRGHIDETT